MKLCLEKILREKYGHILKCTIDTGNGWFYLIDEMLSRVSNIFTDVEIFCIKSKYGSLRIYAKSVSEEIQDIFDDIEHRSSYVCEFCGQKARTVKIKSWTYTVCDKCKTRIRKGEVLWIG